MAFTVQCLHCLCLALGLISSGLWPSITSARPIDNENLLMRARFEEWMAKHSRVYNDLAEKEHHFRNFQKNVERIESIDNNSSTKRLFKVGVNAFTDLNDTEFQAMFTGLRTQRPFGLRSNGRFRYKNFTQPPEAKDWREDGAVTPIKFQGECGSCWAFSAVAAIEGLNQIKNEELIAYSEQQLVDCNTDNNGCRANGRMDRAFTFIQEDGGLTTEEGYPYEGVEGDCRAPDEERAVTITGYEALPEGDEDALLQAVANQPISVGLDAEAPDFRDYAGGIYDSDCGLGFNHAVTLVGYGTDEEEGVDFWIAKNSWGEEWGEEGYIRLVRGQNKCGIANVASYPVMD